MQYRHDARPTSPRAHDGAEIGATTPDELAPDRHPLEQPRPEQRDDDPLEASPDAVAFVRFCYARRPVGWPALYDEMCRVAACAVFNGWGYAELAAHGIAFTLTGLPRLKALTGALLEEERAAGREVPDTAPERPLPRRRAAPVRPAAAVRPLPVTRANGR